MFSLPDLLLLVATLNYHSYYLAFVYLFDIFAVFSPLTMNKFIELVPTNQQNEHQTQSSTFLQFHLTHFSFRTTDVRNLIVFLLAIFEREKKVT